VPLNATYVHYIIASILYKINIYGRFMGQSLVEILSFATCLLQLKNVACNYTCSMQLQNIACNYTCCMQLQNNCM
jgi:hypothetical protein